MQQLRGTLYDVNAVYRTQSLESNSYTIRLYLKLWRGNKIKSR